MKNRFCKLLVFTALVVTLTSLTSCEYFVNVEFEIADNGNDTLKFTGWQGTNIVCRTCPFTSDSGDVLHYRAVSYIFASGGPSVSVSEELAFDKLMYDYDSVMLSRSSDGASTIIFRHDENATDEQRYFFMREAWQCNPEGETEKDRTYTLILKEEMFE